jgi:Fe-S-cluster containining protein
VTPLPPEVRARLEALYARASARASAVQAARPDWPCRRGCDHCCRALAAPLPLTRVEWRYLAEGLAALPPDLRARVREEAAALHTAQRPFTCPLLDREQGACRVYAHRPLACRTYGFFADREALQACHLILAHLEEGPGRDAVVWGNGEAVEREAEALGGPARPLAEWLGDAEGDGPS